MSRTLALWIMALMLALIADRLAKLILILVEIVEVLKAC